MRGHVASRAVVIAPAHGAHNQRVGALFRQVIVHIPPLHGSAASFALDGRLGAVVVYVVSKRGDKHPIGAQTARPGDEVAVGLVRVKVLLMDHPVASVVFARCSLHLTLVSHVGIRELQRAPPRAYGGFIGLLALPGGWLVHDAALQEKHRLADFMDNVFWRRRLDHAARTPHIHLAHERPCARERVEHVQERVLAYGACHRRGPEFARLLPMRDASFTTAVVALADCGRLPHNHVADRAPELFPQRNAHGV